MNKIWKLLRMGKIRQMKGRRKERNEEESKKNEDSRG